MKQRKNQGVFWIQARNFNIQTIKNEDTNNDNTFKDLSNSNDNNITSSMEKNNNAIDKYENTIENINIINNTDDFSIRDKNKTQIYEESKLLNIIKPSKNDIFDENIDSLKKIDKKNFTFFHDDKTKNTERKARIYSTFMKKDSKKKINKEFLFNKKEIIRNNYSVTNISDIKFNKIILSASLFSKNRNEKKQLKGSSSLENKGNKNNTSLLLNSKINKTTFDFNKTKTKKKENSKNEKFVESSRNINRIEKNKLNKDVNSLVIKSYKSHDNALNNFDNLKKGKHISLSSKREKSKMVNNIQNGFRKNR